MPIQPTNTNGGMIADIVCLAIIAIFAISNYKKGLMAQIFKVLCTIGALALAYFFSETLTTYLSQNYELDNVISQKLQEFFGQGATFLAELTEENLQTAINELKLPDFIADFALSSINNGVFENIGDYLAQIMTHYLLLAISFIAIFIVSKLLLTLVSKLLVQIIKLPILRGIDSFLGLIWGLVKATLLIFALMFIIEILPGNLFIEAKTAIDNSLFASFLHEFNLFSTAMSWIATKLNI